ncbi:MAG: OmpA family protein [Vicingaceae bacterium]
MRIFFLNLIILVSYNGYSQEIDTSKYYNIKAIHSGHFLSVAGNSMKNNARVIQWSSNDNSSEDGQSFKFIPVNNHYKIVSRNKDGKSLTISENKMGALVLLSKYTSSDFQLWAVSQENNNYKIVNKANGWSLDIAGVSMEKGAPLSVWENINGAKNQLFTLSEAKEELPYWENLGSTINSEISETSLCLSPDGKQMYFSRGNNINRLIPNGNIFFSSLNKEGKWNEPILVNQLNSKKHNGVVGFLPGGNELLLFGDYTNNNALFSITKKSEDGWTTPLPVDIKLPKLTQNVWSGTIGSDGKTILFEINVTGRMNESDIYVALLDDKNNWSAPINLGKKINVPKAWDGTPFLSPDMTTLYFNSTREGKGSKIYMSKRQNNSWTEWSDPIEIKTSMYTGALLQYYQSVGNGEFAYFVSNIKSFGEGDIFRVKLKDEMKPDPFLIVNGQTLDKESNEPISATIIFEDLTTNKKIGKLTSNPENGLYQIALPKGSKIGFYATTNNYYPNSDFLNLKDLDTYSELKKDLYLSPIKIGETVILNNIFFDTGKSTLKKESFPELNRVLRLIKENPGIELEIRGHTDNVGTPENNQLLSKKRAAAVKDYLVKKGVKASTIFSKGFGETKPITTNDTVEGKAQNRRVEFYILNK